MMHFKEISLMPLWGISSCAAVIYRAFWHHHRERLNWFKKIHKIIMQLKQAKQKQVRSSLYLRYVSDVAFISFFFPVRSLLESPVKPSQRFYKSFAENVKKKTKTKQMGMSLENSFDSYIKGQFHVMHLAIWLQYNCPATEIFLSLCWDSQVLKQLPL